MASFQVQIALSKNCSKTRVYLSGEVNFLFSNPAPPDPPTDVRLFSCSSTRAEVTWTAGEENNDVVTEFILYYNTSFDAQGTFHEGERVPRGRTSASIELSPWANYTFHVKARNSLGLSQPSLFTVLCSSPERRPYSDPENVCVVSEDPTKLIIVWDVSRKEKE